MVTTQETANGSCKSCLLCYQEGCSESRRYFLTDCNFLPGRERRYIAKSRQIPDILDDSPEPETAPIPDTMDSDIECVAPTQSPRIVHIQTRKAPYLDMFGSQRPVRVTIDSSLIGNTIQLKVTHRLTFSVGLPSRRLITSSCRCPDAFLVHP